MAAGVKLSAEKVVVSGSLAYDLIMNFSGRFGDYILPNQVHNLNLSFLASGLRQSDGGTAGNIAYNLSLLGIKPTILGVAGSDFLPYRRRLDLAGVNTSLVKAVSQSKTATAHIITDRQDNQIAAFYPGPAPEDYVGQAARRLGETHLAIISADDKRRMLSYVSLYRSSCIPYIFDPGQAAMAFSAAELRRSLAGATVLIGNDYEIRLISRALRSDISSLARLVPVVVVTKGEKGSEVYFRGKSVKIRPAKPKNSSDPTGAGDAFRAGFIRGMLSGYDPATCARIGSVAAVYTVERYGTQTHRYSRAAFVRRYLENYQTKIKL